ncbi:MAG: DUF1848 domain-containing protein [Helicobacteraceae bacterium]|nr:DUF1848 domain-containing protein [Helicobacteraceae bacterium]
MSDKKIEMQDDCGSIVEAQAPIIVSASRSTDIPRYYAEWFFNRLKKGYVVWVNPFNQKPMYISFDQTRAIIFWSKNPKPIIPYLEKLDERKINYYFQFTLNDYDREKLEPYVPEVAERIETFIELSEKIGKEKVIWRFDPLIVAPNFISVSDLLERIKNIGEKLKKYTQKLVFSFVDVQAYRKVRNNLAKETRLYNELTHEQMIEIAEGLAALRDQWKSEGYDIALGTCAEEIDLDKYGISHNHCIDGELMRKLFCNDEKLMEHLGYERDLTASDGWSEKPSKNMKDKGQRKPCGCIVSKDIGAYNTCPHFCVYCYANFSKKWVENNRRSHSVESESIVPIEDISQ